jgi:3-hydroxyisobutyrate dehydrogenase-like beta-hydroxyacid dehydrogenase
MNAISRIGILGLGKMGAPMAKHLLAAGFKVAGYDPAVSASLPGLHRMASPREVAHASELVLIVVGFEREVEDRSSVRTASWKPRVPA